MSEQSLIVFELKTCICSHPAAETKVGLIFLRVSKEPENQPHVSPQPKRCTDVSCGCPEKISGLHRLQPPSLSSASCAASMGERRALQHLQQALLGKRYNSRGGNKIKKQLLPADKTELLLAFYQPFA